MSYRRHGALFAAFQQAVPAGLSAEEQARLTALSDEEFVAEYNRHGARHGFEPVTLDEMRNGRQLPEDEWREQYLAETGQ